MGNLSLSKVFVYHDETKEVPGRNFKGHVLLFVPVELIIISKTPLFGLDSVEYHPRDEIAQEVLGVRRDFNYRGKFHFSKIGGSKWGTDDLAHRKAVELVVDGLCHKHQKLFKRPLHCKLAVMFYPSEADYLIYGGETKKEQKLRHDETVLRMLLKGAAHYLYDDNNRIEVANIISDGQPEHRSLDSDRILWRLTYDGLYGRAPLRDYVSLSPNATIIHLPSDHRNYEPTGEEYINAHMLQLADLMLGASLRSCYVGMTSRKTLPRIGDECVKKDIIAQPVQEMLDKRKRGGGFRYSGHYRSFNVTLVEFSEGGANFREVHTKQVPMSDSDALQMRFPFDGEA
ncbi:MAG: hypothetical protein ABSA01_10245 [Anaerolineales bacterium]|jgi:hypothetical protein